MLAYDLFCGPGGASLGIKQAGFDVVGFDNDEDSVTTHNLNRLNAVKADVKQFNPNTWTPPDLLWGSPPCQPFSQAVKGVGGKDPRDCVPDFIRLVLSWNPARFVMENVKGLAYKRNADYFGDVLDRLRAGGYNVDYAVLDASKYGVPQSRKRLFVLGSLDGQPKFPTPRDNKVTMAEALGWTADDAAERSLHGDDVSWVFQRPAMTVVGSFKPQVMAGPGYRKAGDPSRQNAARSVVITEQEAATLQTFPPDYQFFGTETSRWRQLGNAVPPLLAKQLVESLA